ncbi:MAG: T9SS type A sorting domain-containing protein [Nitrosopumilaceae archaeon]|nr:T9SS type A sorting domain-containing protein [Nitrosopumilaceae archaeon]NIU86077.1 T9SS type A sorting domain-containing protein [Nitrosopumilaceae archaeon]NIX62347.1 T9SS type A sorting domain-containing protein [Nitrosopumilaceae archaeon]
MKNFWYLKILLLLILSPCILKSQVINYTDLPSTRQLYPRDSQDSAEVVISGTIVSSGYDSIIVEIDTNTVLWQRPTQGLTGSGDESFSFNPKIYSDTVEFSFEILLKQGMTTTSDTLIDSVVCGDVYFINGQSNATNNGGDFSIPWLRSFGTSKNQERSQFNTNWYLATRARYNDGAIGTWGMRLGILIVTNHGIPVCILQQGQGGKSISYFTDGIGGDTTVTPFSNFDLLLIRASNAGVTDAVKAIFWWQGESDTDDITEVNNYENEFLTLYDGWLSFYPNIQKVYTTQLHPGPLGIYADQIREIQRKITNDSSDIEIITPHNIGGFDGVHHDVPGYQNYAAKLYEMVARDFYGKVVDTVDIDPPNITNAHFIDANKDALVLEFTGTQSISFKEDTTIGPTTYFLKDHFYFHNSSGTIDTAIVDSIAVFSNQIRLALTQTSDAEKITYLPAQFYNSTVIEYDGPWLSSSQGIAALTFWQFNIDTQFGDDPLPVTLSSFSGDFIEDKIILKWRTESEINNLGFIILRKKGTETNYSFLANYENNLELRGQGTTNSATEYSYIDDNINQGEIYYYLLRDIDFTGKAVDHGPIKVSTSVVNIPEKSMLYQNYPNPFNNSTVIPFFISERERVELSIYDSLGRKIKTLINKPLKAGSYKYNFDALNLPSGYYYFKLKTTNTTTVKKMTLVK